MSPSSQGSHPRAAGRTCRWLGGQTSEEMTPYVSCLRLVRAAPSSRGCASSVFVLLLYLAFLSVCGSSSSFPPPPFPGSLSCTLLFYTYFSLCPSLSLLPWLLPSSNEVGRQEDGWKIQGPMMLLPFVIVLLSLPLLNLYLFQVFN